MSTRLDLPPERDLPESRRRAIRAELVAATRTPDRRRRPWLVLAPVAVLATVLAVVLGLTRPFDVAPPVVGVPSASPTPQPTESIDWEPLQGRKPLPNLAIPPADPIDLGPLPAGARATAIAECQGALGRRNGVTEVHFARRTSTDGDVVLFTDRRGVSYACSKGGGGQYADNRSAALPRPTRRHPVFRMFDSGSGGSRSDDGATQGDAHGWYRVGPEVASLQLRLTVEGHTGPWFEASRDGGYAWAAASVDYRTTARGALPREEFTIEDRAFDAEGNELAIDRTRG